VFVREIWEEQERGSEREGKRGRERERKRKRERKRERERGNGRKKERERETVSQRDRHRQRETMRQRLWIRRSKIQSSTRFLEGGGLEGRQAFWTLRPTKKLGTRSKVGN